MADVNGAQNHFSPPIKWLNGQGDNVPPMPKCLGHGRYDTLSLVQSHLDNSKRLERSGGQPLRRGKANRWIQDTSFVLASMEDSISPWHIDRHALHTAISPLVGEKLWIMISFKNDVRGRKGRRRFLRKGVEFDVEEAISKNECDIWWTIVGPDISLVMFDSVPHMVYTLSDCIYTGKSFLDAGDLKNWLTAFRREYKYNGFAQATNEDPASDVSEALTAMKGLLDMFALRTRGVAEEDESAIRSGLEHASEVVAKKPTPEAWVDFLSDSEADLELEESDGGHCRAGPSGPLHFPEVKSTVVNTPRKRKR